MCRWYPATRAVAVARGAVAQVTFSQVRARVRGRVVTRGAAEARGLRLRLRPLAPDGGYAERAHVLTALPNHS